MLLDDIREIGDRPPTLAPGDRRAELDNTVWLGATVEDRDSVTAADVCAGFEQTAARLREHVAGAGYRGVATFYVWHDEQAGQLRCSVGTQPAQELPFGGSYRATTDLSEVVEPFLTDTSPGFVPWSDLVPVTDDYEEPNSPPFPVWAIPIGTPD